MPFGTLGGTRASQTQKDSRTEQIPPEQAPSELPSAEHDEFKKIMHSLHRTTSGSTQDETSGKKRLQEAMAATGARIKKKISVNHQRSIILTQGYWK